MLTGHPVAVNVDSRKNDPDSICLTVNLPPKTPFAINKHRFNELQVNKFEIKMEKQMKLLVIHPRRVIIRIP